MYPNKKMPTQFIDPANVQKHSWESLNTAIETRLILITNRLGKLRSSKYRYIDGNNDKTRTQTQNTTVQPPPKIVSHLLKKAHFFGYDMKTSRITQMITIDRLHSSETSISLKYNNDTPNAARISHERVQTTL